MTSVPHQLPEGISGDFTCPPKRVEEPCSWEPRPQLRSPSAARRHQWRLGLLQGLAQSGDVPHQLPEGISGDGGWCRPWIVLQLVMFPISCLKASVETCIQATGAETGGMDSSPSAA